MSTTSAVMNNRVPVLLLVISITLVTGWLMGNWPGPPHAVESMQVAGGVEIGGNLDVLGSKNFRIDHPLDPANRYLVHFASEGPEPFNVYAGRQVLEQDGTAWIALPVWFEAINIEFRYQLTSIGVPAPGLHVMTEIENNRFRIGGGPAVGEVSWEVRARRNDPTMQRLDPMAEIDKPAHLQGSYLDPLVWDN